MVLVDGENLVFRFQAMLEKGKKMNPHVVHIPDVFVWHQNMGIMPGCIPVRVASYTSAVADQDRIAELERTIADIPVHSRNEFDTQICPRVFKKYARSRKAKIVDMSICIDALRHSYDHHVDAILILSGDADYLPLVKEIMRSGTQVGIGAFSDGLSPSLRPAVDWFVDLDPWCYISERGAA